MGQQQLLLIILSVIVVGVAVAMGITMFTDSSIDENRDAITNDLTALASRAHQYFRRPSVFGGGGNSFAGLTADAAGMRKLTNSPKNENGVYSIAAPSSGSGLTVNIELLGVGTELVDGNYVTVRCRVFADHDSVWVTH